MLKPADQTHRQLGWFVAQGVREFDVAVQRTSGAWLAPHQRLSVGSVGALVPWCRAENVRGGNVYVRPHRHSAVPVVFLDDVSSSAAQHLADTHPALVVQTSPDRCHVWLATDRTLTESERYRVQAGLARRSVGGKPLADPGSVSGDHYGRLAGFRNRKPGRDCWVNLRLATSNGNPLPLRELVQVRDPLLSTLRGHVEDVPRNGGGRHTRSESETDWAWVMTQLEHGFAPETLTAELTARAAPRRGRDAERYAARTVKKAVERWRIRSVRR